MSELALWDGLADSDLDIGEGDWREEPVGLEEFVRDHLGLGELFPDQSAAMLALLGEAPGRIFKEGRLYQGAVLLWGKGSGKDYICSVLVCYLIYVLLCLRDPQAYFEFGPGEPIDVVNVAYSADQAKYVFFAKLKERVKRWRWLRDRYNIYESGRRVGDYVAGRDSVEINDNHIIFPRYVRSFSRHAQNESYEGMNIIAWIMDEASAFLSKLKRENADAIYSTLRSSANSRFPGRWLGAVISYPRHGDDFTMTKLKEAKAHPERGIYADGPKATWEVNKRVAHEEMVEVRPGHFVPVTFVNDYLADYEDSLAKYECQPPAARDAFFRFPDRLDAAVQRGRAPLIEWEPVVTYRTIEQIDERGEVMEVERRYSAVKLTRFGKLPKGAKLFFHGDPGLVNDSFALCLAHGAPATVMVRVPASEVLDEHEILARGIPGDKLIEWERDVTRAVIDAVIVWRPDPRVGQQVDMLNVRDTIFELKKHYRLGWPAPEPTGTFDHWESAEIVQEMVAKRMNVANEAWSRPFQVDIYRTARTAFYNDLVTLPDTPSITSTDPLHPGALYECKRIEFVDGSKVDHPEGGSKDIADAVVRCIHHVSNATRKSFSYGTAYGHGTAYPDTAPIVPAPGRPVDPNVPPSPITDTKREIERANRLAGPLGELVPAEGTVNGRRFASVRSQ